MRGARGEEWNHRQINVADRIHVARTMVAFYIIHVRVRLRIKIAVRISIYNLVSHVTLRKIDGAK